MNHRAYAMIISDQGLELRLYGQVFISFIVHKNQNVGAGSS